MMTIFLSEAISPYDTYCDGFNNPGAAGSSYVLALLASATTVRKGLCHNGSKVLDQTLAFDRAEVAEANIGQINMIKVSSFCGPMGYIWGYDLARAGEDYLFTDNNMPVYSAENLFKATKVVFGTIDEPNYPILPGAHVPCACRMITQDNETQEPLYLYAAIGLGIAEDRNKQACLLMEDAGTYDTNAISDESIIEKTAKSINKIGQIQGINYIKAFIGMRKVEVKSGEMGCALVAAPYITLAKNAIPLTGFKSLQNMTFEQWKKAVDCS